MACNEASVRNKESCYILSFDGGGSKGVIELVLLKRVFDYVSLLKKQPQVVNWICVKGKTDEAKIMEQLGEDKIVKVIQVREYLEQISSGHWFSWFWTSAKVEPDDVFVVVMKSFYAKLEALENGQKDFVVKDFTNYWIDYWYLVDKKNKKECDEFWPSKSKQLTEIGVRSVQIFDFNDDQALIMPNLDLNAPAESRRKFREIVGELKAEIQMSKFISLIHPNEVFDIMVGTSTGAILSFGLVGGNKDPNSTEDQPKQLPMSIEEGIVMYQQSASTIFSGTWSNCARHKLGMASLIASKYIYTQDSLKEVLEKQFGKQTLLSDLTNEGTIAAAVTRKIGESKDELVLFDTLSESYKLTPVVSALLASADAPVYFKTPVKIGDSLYVDGGVGGNCPLKQVFPLARSRFNKVDFVLSVAPPRQAKQCPDSGLSWLSYFAGLTTDGSIGYDLMKRMKRQTHFLRLYPNLDITSQEEQKTSAKFKQFQEFKLDTTNVTAMISITEDWLNLASSLAFALMSIPPITRRIFGYQDQKCQSLSVHHFQLLKNFGDYIYDRRNQFGLREVREQLERFLDWVKPKDPQAETPHEYIEICSYIGQCFREEKKLSEALKYLKESLDIESRLHSDKPHLHVALCHHELASCLIDDGSYDNALKHQKEALETMKKICEGTSSNIPKQFISMLSQYGLCLYNLRMFSDALHQYETCKNLYVEMGDKADQCQVAKTYNDIGLCFQQLKQYNEAENHHRTALQIMKELYDGKKPGDEFARTYNLIGCCFLEREDHLEAIKYFEESLRIGKQIYGDVPNEAVAKGRNNIAECYFKHGKYDDALQQYQEALKILKEIHRRNCNEYVAICLDNIGSCLLKKDRCRGALGYLERSLSMWRKLYPNQETSEMKIIKEKIDQCQQKDSPVS